MASTTAHVLLWISALGVGMVALQIGLALAHLRRPPPPLLQQPGISILKPLCGVDDALMGNLRTFARLDYPRYEVLLGVRDLGDPAYPIACRAAARWPSRMRVLVQQSAPGLNPKVNQLVTLSQHASYDCFVISDSNVAVQSDYLSEIARYLGDESVGVVTHPIAGAGEETLGALLDNLHLCAFIGPGMIAANLFGQSLAVGKSMAFRRSDLAAIGGFGAFKDLLAEDFAMGRAIAKCCHKRVVAASSSIVNTCTRRGLGEFVRRYTRWNIMQRYMVGRTLYGAQLLLNPMPTALVAVLVHPTRTTWVGLVACAATKTTLEYCAVRRLRPAPGLAIALLAGPLKDFLLLVAFAIGMFKTSVDWRGNRLRVLEGTRLAVLDPSARGSLAVLSSLSHRLVARSWRRAAELWGRYYGTAAPAACRSASASSGTRAL